MAADHKNEFLHELANTSYQIIILPWLTKKKEGKKEGRKEGKWDVVKNSLKEGLPIKTIERITGFPAEEIHRFKEKFVHPA